MNAHHLACPAPTQTPGALGTLLHQLNHHRQLIRDELEHRELTRDPEFERLQEQWLAQLAGTRAYFRFIDRLGG